ncbi:flagellar biosynthetic protein FliR [Cognatishimia sp. 1_MG-2023]|uniref:flagellar biosynthetic protein FliR n=1 Tax=Cognatishimia sp. 1_MG-2023 TaxID=3062642 RepID=UPI0026E1EDB0|nr:flagellar biosynthetic protein FliR [Cognatishimia sp. 1_MG-2023]MDO6726932.1 flagellar biosynthetic protein FliR [Cognatishimia sp. 1_MG-2023]
MNEAAQIWADLQLQFWGAATVFYRIGAAVSMLPGFGESSLSVRLKLLLGIALTIVITPTLGTTARVEPSIWFIFSETAIGLMFGIGVRLFVYTLQTAGAIAANTTSLAQLFSQGQETQLPIISHTLHWAGLALIFHAGVHLTFIGYLISSYALFPIGELPLAADTSAWGIKQISHSFALALQLALPFVAISMLYNLVLGVINRAMPQLMVALVGAPFITGASLVLLAISSPYLLGIWLSALTNYLASPM